MHLKLGRSRTREAWLWHGTARQNLAKICTSGFDRSFGAVEMYGHGIYFARDSKYSCADRYSPPDASGVKYLILSRVLVGETLTGQSTYKSPQPKPAPRELENFESFVDDEASPSIVVATRDFMAMPELILAFIDNANPAAASMRPSDITYDFGVAI